MSKVLLVDDDPLLLGNLRRYFEREGYTVEAVPSGEEAIASMNRQPSDVVVLDVGLPGIGGLDTCRRIRDKHQCPVILLASKADSTDVGSQFASGANDCLEKPVDPLKLLTRVRSYLASKNGAGRLEAVSVGDLTIDFSRRQVLVAGAPAELTNKEYEVVAYLAKHLNRPIARDQLFERVWGYALDFNSNSLDVYIYRIRKRIEQNPGRPRYLQTQRGFGYKLVSPS